MGQVRKGSVAKIPSLSAAFHCLTSGTIATILVAHIYEAAFLITNDLAVVFG